MNGAQLRSMRQARGWTQQKTARRLHVTQAYLSMLESGRRAVPDRLVAALASHFDFPATAWPLPSTASDWPEDELAQALGTLGYPGFAHLRPPSAERHNPAEILLAALSKKNLEARLVEALPWLCLQYAELPWDWLLPKVRQQELQNRLGLVVTLARKVAAQNGLRPAEALLKRQEAALHRGRLAREDTLCHDALTGAERRWLRRQRSRDARRWNLLTDLSTEQLPHAH